MMSEFQRAIFTLILLVGLPVIVGLFALIGGAPVGLVIGSMLGTLAIVGFGMFFARIMDLDG